MIPSILVSSTVQVATNRVATSWPWYVIRGAGFVAAGLIILLMLSGIGQVTGITYRYIEPIKAWALHRALAIALCASIVIHVSFLFIDHYIKFSVIQILLPFESHYNNGTKLWGLSLGNLGVTFGILATYAVLIVVASSLGWIDTKKRAWRKLHYLSYILAFFVFLHALYTGSDLKYGIFRRTWIFAGSIVVIGILLRLYRARTITKS